MKPSANPMWVADWLYSSRTCNWN